MQARYSKGELVKLVGHSKAPDGCYMVHNIFPHKKGSKFPKSWRFAYILVDKEGDMCDASKYYIPEVSLFKVLEKCDNHFLRQFKEMISNSKDD
tara:strand:- start:158 stop:439 length:282 start_codon:yes stop_codon:yes gene_type:complete